MRGLVVCEVLKGLLSVPSEPDFSYLDALAPYQPLAMKCVYCPIDTRLNFHQVSKLLKEIQVSSVSVSMSMSVSVFVTIHKHIIKGAGRGLRQLWNADGRLWTLIVAFDPRTPHLGSRSSTMLQPNDSDNDSRFKSFICHVHVQDMQ